MLKLLLLTPALATLAAIAGPAPAAPTPVPAAAQAICRATPPRVSHAWVGGLSHVAAPAAIGAASHAELLFKLALLEGHLMVGHELIEANQPRLALPHFGHPVRELYGDIEGELRRRGAAPFDGDLVALEALAATSPHAPATMAKYHAVIRTLAAIRTTVPQALLDDERFMLGVLGDVAGTASEDYAESIEGGRIEKPVEYHDSRGYLAYANQVLRTLERREDLAASPRLAAARARLADMQAIVAPLLPPGQPIRSGADFAAIVGQFRQAILPGA